MRRSEPSLEMRIAVFEVASAAAADWAESNNSRACSAKRLTKSLSLPSGKTCAEVIAVHARDHFEPDALGTDGLACAAVGARAEAFAGHLRDHAQSSSRPR